MASLLGAWFGLALVAHLPLDGWLGLVPLALCASCPAALLSRDTSVMRGLVVATVVVWSGALDIGARQWGADPFAAMFQFHQHLSLGVFAWFTLAIALSVSIASRPSPARR
jgi:hypothetical protein